MKTLLDKKYDGESVVDAYRDVSEAFDGKFTPIVKEIPQDKYGFCLGSFRVRIEWVKTLQIRDGFVEPTDKIYWRSEDGPEHVTASVHWANIKEFPELYSFARPTHRIVYDD